jgi:hypothetical protein
MLLLVLQGIFQTGIVIGELVADIGIAAEGSGSLET